MGLNAGHALGHVEGNVVLARVAQQRLAFQVVRTRLLDADDCGLVLVSLVDLGRVAGTGQARDLAELHRARPAAAATGDAERADTADQDHPLRDHRAGTLNETARCAGFPSIVCSVGRLAAGLLDGRPAGNKKSGWAARLVSMRPIRSASRRRAPRGSTASRWRASRSVGYRASVRLGDRGPVARSA